MKKIISILACICILLSVMVINVSAAETSATITFGTSFTDKANRTEYSTEKQVWEENGIKVINNKSASKSNVGDYANPARFYQNSSVTIEYPGMTKLVINGDGTTYVESKHIDAWVNSVTAMADGNVTVAADGMIVTITFANAVDSFNIPDVVKQARALSMTVYAGETGSEGGEVVTPPAEDEKVEPTITKVDKPEVGVAYKYALIHGGLDNKMLFLNGEMSSYYMATTEDPAKAVDVYLEETDGGYHLYAMIGEAKKYMNIVENAEGYANVTFDDNAISVYEYFEERGVYRTTFQDSHRAFGANGQKTYDTIQAVSTKYDQYYCYFYTVEFPEDYVPPVDEDTNTGYDPTGKTAAEIVDAAYALAPGAAFSKAATLTGVIKSVDTEYSSQYSNVTVTIVVDGASADKPIKCFRLKGEGADKIAVGDKITVTGIIKNYQHTSGDTEVEFDAGCTLDSYVKGAVVETPAAKEETKEEEKLAFGVVEQPEAGVAYKFGMYQGNLKKILYITGEMDGFYMATTDDASKAADVYLEKADGGYYIYALVNGAKKYLGIEEATGTDGKTHINAVFTDAPKSVFTYNTTLKTYVTKVGDKEFAFGTRNDREFKTVSPSETKYTENFVCQFYGMTKGGTSPATGDSVGAMVAMTMAMAAVMLYTSKKR